MTRQLAAEILGTALLMVAVVGAAAMSARLTQDPALSLAIAALCSGIALFVGITLFIPVSGGHLNPVVTLAFWMRREIAGTEAIAYGAAQVLGAVAGAVLGHLMFALPAVEISHVARSSPALWLSEAVATFGLIVVVWGAVAGRGPVAALVGTYIAAGTFFTSSMAFANPALTLARAISGTAAGMRPADLPGYIAAEVAGALLAGLLCRWLFTERKTPGLADGG